MAKIHATAFVDPKARIGSDVEIGACCVVGPGVEIGDRVTIRSHAVVTGSARIGAGCQLFPFVSVGYRPQDRQYRGEPSTLTIGPNTVIGERVTINRGTERGRMTTTVGAGCRLLGGSHVAHDCQIGDHVTVAPGATLAGHVTIGDHAVLASQVAVQQFVRIGCHAAIGEGAGVAGDVIPFARVTAGSGRAAGISGLNLAGLEGKGFPCEQVQELRRAYRQLLSSEGTLKERVVNVEEIFAGNPLIEQVTHFIKRGTNRAFCLQNQTAN